MYVVGFLCVRLSNKKPLQCVVVFTSLTRSVCTRIWPNLVYRMWHQSIVKRKGISRPWRADIPYIWKYSYFNAFVFHTIHTRKTIRNDTIMSFMVHSYLAPITDIYNSSAFNSQVIWTVCAWFIGEDKRVKCSFDKEILTLGMRMRDCI